MKELEAKVNKLNVTVELTRQDVKYIKKAFEDEAEKYVSVSRFKPIERIAYALAGGSLLWVLSQLLGLIQTAQSFF